MATPSANGDYERSLPQAESIGAGQLGKGNLYGAEVDMRFRTQALDRVFTRDTVPKDAWIEIDLDAIAHNVRVTRARIGANRQIAAVVKADAYGHGAIPVARVALKNGADRLAVSSVEEGAKLRNAGINAPILILSQPPDYTVDLLLKYNLVPTVCTVGFARALGEAAARRGVVAPFHLAIDTGMNRIGVRSYDAADFCRAIAHKGLLLEGTFTHFATADEEPQTDFRKQLARFDEALSEMRAAGFNPGIVHAANSAAIERFPETHFDMVRLGITMYGLAPAPTLRGLDDLRPAMAVKCRITYAKEPAVGEGVSYGMNYRVEKPVQIVTVPLGYADGLSRALSGRMQVILNGRICNQVGNICMDQMMIEGPVSESGVCAAEKGDEVVIIGSQGVHEITVDDMADLLGTINYEIICDFKMRLPRVYLGTGGI